MKQFAFIFILSLFNIIVVFSQERDIYYLTGFPAQEEADNETSRWVRFIEEHGTRTSINPISFGYQNSLGLVAASTDAATYMTGENPINEAVGIGSSFGGTVLRQIDAFSGNSPFGGFITLGAPNQGAPIANMVIDGSILTTITGWIGDLSAGPIAEIFSWPLFTIEELVVEGFIPNLLGNIPIGESNLGNFISNPPASIIDMSPGSTALNNINNYNSSLSSVQITTEEDEQGLYRLAGSSKSYEAPLGEFLDNKIVERADKIAGVYSAFKKANYIASDVTNILGFSSLLGLSSGIYEHVGNEWKRGEDALETHIEMDWNSMIGATEITTTTTVVGPGCNLNPTELANCQYYTDGGLPQSCLDCEGASTYTYQEVTILASDAFIPVANQTFSGADVTLEVTGCNHMEMVNHPIVRNRFNALFDGNIEDASFFISEE